MTSLDIQAEIVSGKSAAGFRLGMDVSEVREIVSVLPSIPDLPNNHDLRQNKSALVTRSNSGDVEAIFFGDDIVRLCFNSSGKIFCIFVFQGYQGSYLKRFGIGSLISDINMTSPLTYDDEDEMFYSHAAPGIAIVGRSCSLEDDPEQTVSGFCIFDWSQKS